jgi:hypothetical protein
LNDNKHLVFAVEEISRHVPRNRGQTLLPVPRKSGKLQCMQNESPAQLDLTIPRSALRPTGHTWQVTPEKPATVPVPLPVVMVRIEGSYTTLDRKLWLLLLHHAWDDLDNPTKIHEAAVADVLRLFRQFGRRDLGQRGVIEKTEQGEAAAIWESVKRISKTTVEWEDKEYKGISTLLASAMTAKKYRETGRIYYTFSALLAKHVLVPRSYARLRIHFIMGLHSKYAVTLYEVLEAYVNRHEATCLATVAELRGWLKVPDDSSYTDWKYLRRRVIDPAVDEINEHAEDAGFSVAYEGVREGGKAFTKIKFTVTKTEARADRDETLQKKATRAKRFTHKPGAIEPSAPYNPPDHVLNNLRTIAPGWDRQALIADFNAWKKGKAAAANPDGAFIGWVKKVTKGKPAS